MDELMQMPTNAGGSVLVEIDTSGSGYRRVSRDGAVFKAKETFEHALGDVKEAALSALKVMTSGPDCPDAVDVEFGVKFTAEMGAVLAKATAEGHLAIRLKWSRVKSAAASDDFDSDIADPAKMP